MAVGKVVVSAFTEQIAGVCILLFFFYLFEWVEKGFKIVFKNASFKEIHRSFCA